MMVRASTDELPLESGDRALYIANRRRPQGAWSAATNWSMRRGHHLRGCVL
eukprot:CAMPEP_0172888480 /NCGR_PEP_ID=MMETSP1075-20121228/136548_1 /TAXON_ID=2916 /ORGANISM="Ceratium fusus, Strain PA161109" /LENGTH=50 /DNA_ID=CAMNT_0013742371 /DNA_START=41 /DNA_END=190 /DNA_ORIENTATION=+